MKICFLTRSLDPGGMETQLHVLARGLTGKGHEVVVLVLYPGGNLENYSHFDHLKVRILGKRSRWHFLSVFRNLLQSIRDENPDVLQSYLTASNILASLTKPFPKAIPIVWGIRSSEMHLQQYDFFMRAAFRVERLLSRFADCIIVNSGAGLAYAKRNGFACKNFAMIHNGIDTDQFRRDEEGGVAVRREWGISADQRLIGLVGRLDPVKDHPTFLRAAALLLQKRSDLRFACVGSGDQEYAKRLKALTMELGLDRFVIWQETRMDMVRVYSAFDLVVSTSLAEGFSNVLAEAMACGALCVATEVGDSKQILGDCGITVAPSSPEAMALAWERGLKSDRSDFGSRARMRILEHYGVNRLVAETVRIYSSLVPGGN